MNKKLFLLVAVFATALFVRFHNFETRVLYGPEQGISLLSAAGNLKSPSLLGIPYLLRTTTFGHQLFTSPLFGYSLIPLVVLFNHDPIKITAAFALLNVLTGLVVYLVAGKIFGRAVGIFSSLVFLFSAHMIYHSLFIWISNYMPLVGILTVYGLYMFIKEGGLKWVFLLGLVSGVGFGLQYIYLFAIALVLFLVVKHSKRKLLCLSVFAAGGVLGELPTALFDLRHNFYHLNTLWRYFLDAVSNPQASQISYYHFLALWPAAAIILGFILAKIFQGNRALGAFLVILYMAVNLSSARVSFGVPLGMPDSLTAKDLMLVAQEISDDKPEDFNVTVLMDFDFRGYSLRYPLEFIHGSVPMGVEEYPDARALYVLAGRDYNFDKPDLWEIRSFLPYEVAKMSDIKGSYGLYKLTK